VLGETGLLLGVRSKEAYADSEFSFEVGDRLLLYTDGLLEAENAAGESFGNAALATFIKERQELRAEQFVDLLLKEVLAWTRAGQEDDITIVVIDIYHRSRVEEMTYSTSLSGASAAVGLSR
jgi:sigma-B regulation protein RsbU (phosphoserine phosphatase)